MTATAVRQFPTELALRDYLESMNYDHGLEPELAIVDANGSVALACGTDEGDEMGYAYYRTNGEGRMPCGCCGAEAERWSPVFPVTAIGAAIATLPTTTPDADPDDGGTPDCGGTCCSHVTRDPDADEYPVGSVEG